MTGNISCTGCACKETKILFQGTFLLGFFSGNAPWLCQQASINFFRGLTSVAVDFMMRLEIKINPFSVQRRGFACLITEELASAVLREAQKSGADYADLFLEDNESTRIEMTDGKVENANYARICGAGVRVLLGTNSAYAYCAETSEQALMETARAAAAALGEAKYAPDSGIVRSLMRLTTPVLQRFDEIGNADRVAVMRIGALAMKNASGEITQGARKVSGSGAARHHRLHRRCVCIRRTAAYADCPAGGRHEGHGSADRVCSTRLLLRV